MTEITEQDMIEVFNVCLGMPPRQADIQLMKMMGLTVENLSEYIWDHWLGEPDEPSLEEVEEKILEVIRK